MTFAQVLVLVVIVCVSAIQCVTVLATASVRKKMIGVPDTGEITKMVVGAMVEADNTGSMVRISFSDWGTEMVYTPKEILDEPVQDGD